MNRQVPEKQNIKPVAIVGNGKVARHMIEYFNQIGQPYIQWFRHARSTHNTEPQNSTPQKVESDLALSKLAQSKLARFKQKIQRLINASSIKSLDQSLNGIDTVLLLLPDDQIEPFINQNNILKDKTCVHFSGSLNSVLAVACHPLMTFGSDLYEPEFYPSIPFVVDEGVDFKALFPLLMNPVHPIKAEHKARYHAYCVMAGNFSQLLWKTISDEMQNINLPKDLMANYLLQNTKNFIANPDSSVTGPFERGDLATIEKHQFALNNHPLAHVYQAFYDLNDSPLPAVKRSAS